MEQNLWPLMSDNNSIYSNSSLDSNDESFATSPSITSSDTLEMPVYSNNDEHSVTYDDSAYRYQQRLHRFLQQQDELLTHKLKTSKLVQQHQQQQRKAVKPRPEDLDTVLAELDSQCKREHIKTLDSQRSVFRPRQTDVFEDALEEFVKPSSSHMEVNTSVVHNRIFRIDVSLRSDLYIRDVMLEVHGSLLYVKGFQKGGWFRLKQIAVELSIPLPSNLVSYDPSSFSYYLESGVLTVNIPLLCNF